MPSRRAATVDTTPQPQLAIGQPDVEAVEAPPAAVGLPQLLTTAQVGAALGIDPYTVRRWVSQGVLPAYRVGRELRIDQAAVRRLLAERAVVR